MDKIRSILLKIIITVVIVLVIPFLLIMGMIYFTTKGIKLIKLRKNAREVKSLKMKHKKDNEEEKIV